MAKQRIVYLDLVKLFTIYLVILGHVIAMMVNGYSVGEKLYSFIYSFHMPLFMLLSGYFVSSRSLEMPFLVLLKTKAQQLLLPVVTCTVICCIYLFFFRGLVNYRDEIIGNSWFLKTLFVYYVLFYLLKRTNVNDILMLFGSCAILFLMPHASSLQVNLLWPYFVGGYLMRRYDIISKVSFSWKFALLFLLLFGCTFMMQRKLGIPNYIAINVDSIQSQWHLILLRYIVAFSGSMTTITLISMIFKYFENNAMTKIAKYGQWTLGVYVLQTILVANIFPDTLAWYVESEFLLDVVIAPALSITFLLICLLFICVLSRNKTLDLFFLGGQYK